MGIPIPNAHNKIFGSANNWHINWDTVEHSDILIGHEVNIVFFSKVLRSIKRVTTELYMVLPGVQPTVEVQWMSVWEYGTRYQGHK